MNIQNNEKPRYKDISGRRFGMLKVQKFAGSHVNGHHALWECLCDCGVVCTVRGSQLRAGHIVSCGCRKAKILTRLNKKRATHKMTGSRLINIYHGMVQRCEYPRHKWFNLYGGRGITVCMAWRMSSVTFVNWAKSHGYRGHLTLDRINNDMGYTPSNCRWATCRQQAQNRRRAT